jgi:hypothetical protein
LKNGSYHTSEEIPLLLESMEKLSRSLFHFKLNVELRIWHYVKDLRALMNWCIRKNRLDENPVTKADLSLIKNRKSLNCPLILKRLMMGSILYGVKTGYMLILFGSWVYGKMKGTGSKQRTLLAGG